VWGGGALTLPLGSSNLSSRAKNGALWDLFVQYSTVNTGSPYLKPDQRCGLAGGVFKLSHDLVVLRTPVYTQHMFTNIVHST
jgi:hypothetical protein